ncbi:MAG: O-antigen ligase family protein, partial [Candidatus Omnitrophica bacterium]|nr:O-antigen ligase family protein [Candidatus Omnitrophota bacterium]
IWQHFFKQELIFQKAITYEGRVTGPFGHPNDFGSYLLTAAVFFVGALTWAWNGRREPSAKPGIHLGGTGRFIVIFIGALMAATALGWTFSRGAWIGFACASILLAVFHGKKWYVPLIFLAVFWVVFSSQLGSVRNVSFITDDISMAGRLRVKRLAKEETMEKKTELQLYVDDVLSALSRFNWTGRQVFWAETFEVFKAAPVFGTGLNTYTEAVQRYNKPWSGFYSHNCYLQMLAEIGIVGLASFLWLMIVLALESWKVLMKLPNGYYRVVLMGLFSGLVGFWVHGAMDTNFYSARLGNLMWILMGLVAAVIQLAGKDPDQRKI